MTEHEDALRQREQARALDVYSPSSGAMIRHTPLDRVQEVIAVNRTDLENIRSFDWTGNLFGGIGTFLFGGGLWLGIDKFSDWHTGEIPIIVVICISIVCIGAISMAVGFFFSKTKRNYIDKIFGETRVADR